MSTEAEPLARRVLRHMDLTSLGNQDDAERKSIAGLLAEARKAPVLVSALCTWPQFMPLVVASNEAARKEDPAAKLIVPCTVINFPQGNAALGVIRATTRHALSLGAREIDYVIDHASLMKGDSRAVEQGLKACRDMVPSDVPLKVILESAAILPNRDKLREASIMALDNGADFLKTSTGKHAAGGASPEAIAIMLDAIAGQSRAVGIKPSGGLRKIEDAVPYFQLADKAFGVETRADRLRLGASRTLFDDAVRIINGPSARSVAAPEVGAKTSLSY